MPKLTHFFEKPTEASKVKMAIVVEYFAAWSQVMASQGSHRIAYLDLFSGPGRYDDGTPSTPLRILGSAINHFNENVRKVTYFIFNDSDLISATKLEQEIRSLPRISLLVHPPSVHNFKVDNELAEFYSSFKQAPTLSFIDPWGYKGLSLDLVKSLAKDWGSDSIFFFNYRRVNPGIVNKALERPISDLFSYDVLLELREKIIGQSTQMREKIILTTIRQVFKGWDIPYVFPFPFKNERGTRTTHYLIFVCKNFLGYDIMKNIMAKHSSYRIQKVPSFEYNPAKASRIAHQLFSLEKPIDDLKSILLRDFSKKQSSMRMIYETHSVDKPYTARNYKDALMQLETEERIHTNRSERKARKGTFPDDLIVLFP